ncbi:MAG TPA: alpha/beta fold hydrolase [Candidatus Binataceae bacterium]|nr:alpha/beta fold hydrolase [Candidatus Binataceae bacterium]
MQESETVVPFRAGDGMALNLIHIETAQPPTRGPVIVVHGAGVRANLFRPPVGTTFVQALLQHGYDVWLENWRASIDLPPSEWTLDKAALYDHPQAVRTVLAQTGATSLKAVIHCQGSTSFMMAAVAGLLPEVRTIVSNAVSLHTRIPSITHATYSLTLPIMKRMVDYLDPQWGIHAPTVTAKLITAFVRATHHECNNTVCRLVSFTYGVGHPTLWSHEYLNAATHEWIRHEFAKVPITFFAQMFRCVQAGHLISVDNLPGLPSDYLAQKPETDARIAFIAGEQNRCFLAEGQRETFAYFNRLHPGRYALHVLPGYGHLDVFLGKDAATQTFPLMIEELDKE